MSIKVLYTSNSASLGGMENHLLDLIKGLAQRDYEIIIFCPPGEMVKKYQNSGAKVIIDYPRLDFDLGYIVRVYKFLKEEKIHIFHAHQLKTVINGLIAAKFAQTPVKVAHIHSPLINWQITRIKKCFNIIINAVVTNLCADVVLALSAATKRERINGEHISSSRIKVIPNGIDIEKFKVSAKGGSASGGKKEKLKVKEDFLEKYKIPKDKVVIGTLSRLTEEKGVDVLIEAVAKIPKEKRESLFFVIAGDGPLKSGLENLVSRLKVRDKVQFLGFIGEEEKVNFYTSLDIFIFPTLHEGFGLVLGEAMAMGIPTISSDLPTLKEITGSGESGIHFKRADSHDLAIKVVNLTEAKDTWERVSIIARDRIVRDYSLDKFIDNYDKFYKEALKP